jgi:hypothetical protein
LVLATALAAPAEAQAASPLKIRELYPGSVAAPGAEYVQLQMSAADQSAIAGQGLRFYGPSGAESSSFTVPSNVTNGQSQRAVLLATQAAEAGLALPPPDFTLPPGDRISPAGGAVCFTGAGSGLEDCATWGSFPVLGPFEPSPIPDRQGENAAAIGDEMALRRSIAPGCETLLDSPDDSGNSAADFEEVLPEPHDNAEAPGEELCPPETLIQTRPTSPTNSQAAAFTYAALPEEAGTVFKCSLDGATFADCTPGGAKTYSPLSEGLHTFRVFATGPTGKEDLTPDSDTWTVDTTAPETTVDSGPPEPSSGFSATFAFHSSEANSSFRCQLDQGPFQSCAGSKTYINLLTGIHAFRVFAIDNAGNEDKSAAQHNFNVDNSIEDVIAPDTILLSTPHNPSQSEAASFTYASTEAGSSFQCRLDSAAFSSCPSTGITYSKLRNGSHAFQVKATDKAGNVDQVPATYAWTVAAALPTVKFLSLPPGHVRIKGPKAKKLTVTFRFTASKPGSSFRCRLDKQVFHPCPATTKLKVGSGRHRFEVYAVDALGNRGTQVARRIFRVQQKRKSGGLF